MIMIYGLPLESWLRQPCTFSFVCDPTRPNNNIDPGNKKVGLYLGPIDKFDPLPELERPALKWPVNKIVYDV